MAISSKLLNPGEEVVVSTRTHAKVLLLPLLALVVLLAIAVFVQVQIGSAAVRWIVWVLAAVGILWWFLRPLVQWLAASYTITNRRLITRHGVLTRTGHDIPLTRISDVEYEFGLVDRMLGCGTLMISDASTDGEVTLHDIPHVEDVQRRLNQLLHELHDPSGQGEGV
ncbi:PH domain-containing protein [Nocardioides sp. KR10-350]|uniref:PH domain-containing protein n=1 Tax=Nocardioides cheoyonin TaxID=3156615 RepID=UPI0032B40B98